MASTARTLLTAATLCLVLLPGGCGDNGDTGPADAGIDAMSQATLSFEQLQEACVRTAACNVARYSRIKDCLDNFYNRLDQNAMRQLYANMYSCTNAAVGDCRKIAKCMGFAERPQDPTLKCDATFTSRCDGDKAVVCDIDQNRGGWIQTLDCAKGGLKCGVRDTGSGKVATCGGGTCNLTTYKSQCIDNKHYSCVGGAVQINDCPSQGLQCRDPLKPQCEGTGRSWQDVNPLCCKDYNPACSTTGDILTRVKNGYLWQVDCTKQPGKKKCDGSSLQCAGAGTSCKEDSSFDICDTDVRTLVTCVDGTTAKFDCVKMGFEDGCQAAASGFGAYCRGAYIAE